jgi:hypothetical protein
VTLRLRENASAWVLDPPTCSTHVLDQMEERQNAKTPKKKVLNLFVGEALARRPIWECLPDHFCMQQQPFAETQTPTKFLLWRFGVLAFQIRAPHGEHAAVHEERAAVHEEHVMHAERAAREEGTK